MRFHVPADIIKSASAWRNAVFSRRILLIFGAIYVAMSLFTMLHFLQSSRLGDVFYRTQFEPMYHGTAWKPFVYRVLIPKTTRAIVEATPGEWQQSINDSLYGLKTAPWLSDVRKVMPWLADVYPHKDRIYPRAVATLLIYASLWGFIWAIWRLAALAFPASPAIKWFAPIFGMLLIPSFSWQYLYVYDIPVLFLSTACYYFLLAGKFKHYLICFLLAVLNKESSIFIFLLFTFWGYHRLSATKYASLWTAQCLIYVVIKVALALTYMHNAGWLLEDNLGWVWNRDLLSRSGYHRIFVIAAMFFLFTYRWQEKPVFLKYVFFVLPFFFTAYLFYGYPGEYRVFFDIMPLLLLLAVHTLIDGTGIGRSPFFREGENHARMA